MCNGDFVGARETTSVREDVRRPRWRKDRGLPSLSYDRYLADFPLILEIMASFAVRFPYPPEVLVPTTIDRPTLSSIILIPKVLLLVEQIRPRTA